ncbi:MAG: hypothetical protein HC857_00540 [Synechococcales cyanobacterium RU_4_20]|nr:hypothetical protein [Synechococcales cyanobacterium RU_4_20]
MWQLSITYPYHTYLMPARTKYNEQTVEAFCTTLAICGDIESACQSTGLHLATYYNWLKSRPGFRERIDSSILEFRRTCPEALVRAARKALSDVVYGDKERVTYTKKITTSDRFGTTEEEIVTRTPVAVPRWAIERVLGKQIDEMEALRLLADKNLLPEQTVEKIQSLMEANRDKIRAVLAETLPEKLAVSTGLSDELADSIRKQVLGLYSQDPITVSATVDTGHQPN